MNALDIAGPKGEASGSNRSVGHPVLGLAERGFAVGEFDLVDINILESKTYDARFALLDAYFEWFVALADLQATLGSTPCSRPLIFRNSSSLCLQWHLQSTLLQTLSVHHKLYT